MPCSLAKATNDLKAPLALSLTRLDSGLGAVARIWGEILGLVRHSLPLLGIGRGLLLQANIDVQDRLVMHLAIDWTIVSGAKLSPGRSDRTGFGDIVHSVFQWLDEAAPDQALRRYWQA